MGGRADFPQKEAEESGYGTRLQKLDVSFHLVSIEDLVE